MKRKCKVTFFSPCPVGASDMFYCSSSLAAPEGEEVDPLGFGLLFLLWGDWRAVDACSVRQCSTHPIQLLKAEQFVPIKLGLCTPKSWCWCFFFPSLTSSCRPFCDRLIAVNFKRALSFRSSNSLSDLLQNHAVVNNWFSRRHSNRVCAIFFSYSFEVALFVVSSCSLRRAGWCYLKSHCSYP